MTNKCVTYRLRCLPRCQALCTIHARFFPFQSGVCPVCLETEVNHYPVAGLKSIAIAYKIGSGKATLLSAVVGNKHCHKSHSTSAGQAILPPSRNESQLYQSKSSDLFFFKKNQTKFILRTSFFNFGSPPHRV